MVSRMTFRQTRALRITRSEAVALLDAMDNKDKPFTTWQDHDDISRRLRDLIIWMDAE